MSWFRRTVLTFLFPLVALAIPAAASKYDTVTVEPTKTSIYVGHVNMTMTSFHRSGEVYTADYRAKVFPYFFSNEHGQLWITLTDDDLARLEKGERVEFKGRAQNSAKEERRIEGRATPIDAKQGKIKVRVFVTPKIELIFNTTYRFEE